MGCPVDVQCVGVHPCDQKVVSKRAYRCSCAICHGDMGRNRLADILPIHEVDPCYTVADSLNSNREVLPSLYVVHSVLVVAKAAFERKHVAVLPCVNTCSSLHFALSWPAGGQVAFAAVRAPGQGREGHPRPEQDLSTACAMLGNSYGWRSQASRVTARVGTCTHVCSTPVDDTEEHGVMYMMSHLLRTSN